MPSETLFAELQTRSAALVRSSCAVNRDGTVTSEQRAFPVPIDLSIRRFNTKEYTLTLQPHIFWHRTSTNRSDPSAFAEVSHTSYKHAAGPQHPRQLSVQ